MQLQWQAVSKFDSLLAKVAKTVIDFGTGVSVTHGSNTVTRAGKIVISRSGTVNNNTETVVFDGYKVNGASIRGTKTRTNTLDTATESDSLLRRLLMVRLLSAMEQ